MNSAQIINLVVASMVLSGKIERERGAQVAEALWFSAASFLDFNSCLDALEMIVREA